MKRRPPMSVMEQHYISVLRDCIDRPAPSLSEFAERCRRRLRMFSKRPGWPSRTAVRSALLSLESKRYVRRNNDGRFEVIP